MDYIMIIAAGLFIGLGIGVLIVFVSRAWSRAKQARKTYGFSDMETSQPVKADRRILEGSRADRSTEDFRAG